MATALHFPRHIIMTAIFSPQRRKINTAITGGCLDYFSPLLVNRSRRRKYIFLPLCILLAFPLPAMPTALLFAPVAPCQQAPAFGLKFSLRLVSLSQQSSCENGCTASCFLVKHRRECGLNERTLPSAGNEPSCA